jgi:hypothetical protein
MLKIGTRNKFESHFFRTVVVVGALVVARIYMIDAEWASNIVMVFAMLYALAFLLVLQFLKTPLLPCCLLSMVLVPLLLFMEQSAIRFSAAVMPEGPTFSEYMGLAGNVIEESKKKERLVSTEVDLGNVMKKGLDALATLTEKEERAAMQHDLNRGVTLFSERKAWMDSLSPEEKRAYREEMSAFLVEQGLAGDRYSISAMRESNPTNLVALASFFDELQDETVDHDARIRSIPESLAAIATNLGEGELGENELAVLQHFAELFGANEIDEAMTPARNELKAVQGDSTFLGTVLAAMVQSKSGLPIDQLIAQDGGLERMDSNHRKSQVLEQVNGVSVAGNSGVSEVPDAEKELAMVAEPDPFVRITTHLGVVLVPNNEDEMAEWIAAAQNLELKGYVSLGTEVVVLRNDGTMLRKGEIWSIEYRGFRFNFLIDTIMKDKVSMRAKGREPVSP